MLIKNTFERYGVVAMMLHWIIALLMIGMLALGLYMVALPIGLQKLKLYGWHKEIGVLIFFLALVRLCWRIMNPSPRLPAHLAWWQKTAAQTVHYAFYGFMFLLPLTGWLISSSAGLSVSFFGLLTLPDIVRPSEPLRLLFTVIHQWLAYALILTIFMHVGASLQHHFFYKDDILRRMLP